MAKIENNERIEIILNSEIVGKIELLIEEGLYKNRADFIEKAVVNQFNLHSTTFTKYTKKKSFVIGISYYTAKDLEKCASENKMLDIKVIGSVHFAEDITAELFNRVISRVTIAGSIHAPNQIKDAINKHRFTLLGRPYSDFKELQDK